MPLRHHATPVCLLYDTNLPASACYGFGLFYVRFRVEFWKSVADLSVL